ncbi:hypothetical protein WG906_09880 [Pedobacter sp. P351]|uniref:hypothetical protein n=1 Tax=Pedobacter superstes TaxID=3133441 RepID=UPI0030A02BBF
MSLRNFILILLFIAGVLGLTAWLIEANNPSGVILVPKFWVIFGFLVVITIIAYIVSMAGIKNGGENSVFVIMGAIIIKLLFSMGFVVVYLLKFKVNGLFFAIEFFSLYFSFTSFEVYALLCNLRHQNKT